MNLINILSGLLTPLIAIIAVYIAYQQFQSNRNQGELQIKFEEYRLRLDLYNKRYRIFEEIKKVLLKINQDAQIDLDELRDFNVSTNESKFLFDNDITEFLNELREKAIEYNHLTIDLDNITSYPVDSPGRIEKGENISSVRSWFTYEYQNIENKFNKYLNLKDLI